MTSYTLRIRWCLFDCGWEYPETRGGLATPSAQPAPYYATCQLNLGLELVRQSSKKRAICFKTPRSPPVVSFSLSSTLLHHTDNPNQLLKQHSFCQYSESRFSQVCLPKKSNSRKPSRWSSQPLVLPNNP